MKYKPVGRRAGYTLDALRKDGRCHLPSEDYVTGKHLSSYIVNGDHWLEFVCPILLR
jgi:hypothetical protein